MDGDFEGDGRTLPQHFDPLLLAAFREIHSDFEDIYAVHNDEAGVFTPHAQPKTPAAARDLNSLNGGSKTA